MTNFLSHTRPNRAGGTTRRPPTERSLILQRLRAVDLGNPETRRRGMWRFRTCEWWLRFGWEAWEEVFKPVYERTRFPEYSADVDRAWWTATAILALSCVWGRWEKRTCERGVWAWINRKPEKLVFLFVWLCEGNFTCYLFWRGLTEA